MWSLCRSDTAALDLTMTAHSSGVRRQRASLVSQTSTWWLIGFLDIRKPWAECACSDVCCQSLVILGKESQESKFDHFSTSQILKSGNCNDTELSLVPNLFTIPNICLLKSIIDKIKSRCALIQSACFFQVFYFPHNDPASLSINEWKGWTEYVGNAEWMMGWLWWSF